MSRHDVDRLDDILVAIDTIHSHLTRGPLTDGLVFDAVRVRLIEVGEAVKALPVAVTGQEPTVPWSDIARMRDFLAHRYFDTAHSVIQYTVDHDLVELAAAVKRLRATLSPGD